MEKIVSIHQPNFLPWMGYFYKIAKSDIFVLIDQVQFVKGSVCNRNKIKTNIGTEALMTVPVKLSKGAFQAFNQIEIDYSQKWQSKTLNLIKAHYQKTAYFEDFFMIFENIIKTKYPNLSSLNIELIKIICKELNISTPIYLASQQHYEFGKKNEMNLNIVKHFDGNIYLSGNGAKKYNDAGLFQTNNIKLKYLDFIQPIYQQAWGDFIPNLSIIDYLFNIGKQDINLFNNLES